MGIWGGGEGVHVRIELMTASHCEFLLAELTTQFHQIKNLAGASSFMFF